jgi:hypothetical protein
MNREDHFVQYDNGVVHDSKTGLDWLAGPDEDMDWQAATNWVKNLEVDGGGWRIPNQDELQTLHREGKGQHNMTPLLHVTSWWIWCTEGKNSAHGLVHDFSHGQRDWHSRTPRAIAVRSCTDS